MGSPIREVRCRTQSMGSPMKAICSFPNEMGSSNGLMQARTSQMDECFNPIIIRTHPIK